MIGGETFMPRGKKKGSNMRDEFYSEVGHKRGHGKGKSKKQPEQKEEQDQGAFDLWSIDE